MGFLNQRFFLFFLLLIAVSQVKAATTFGRYVGTIKYDSIQREQLAKLDFIVSREEANQVFLKAILTLHFGDFKSGEYVAYHFDNVRFNILTKTFVFDQADQPVTLVGKQIGENEFTGEFRSAYSGELAKVYLRQGQAVEPKLPLVETIWGEYRGKCNSSISGPKTDTIVQVYTYRSTEGATQVGDPFRAYKIKGYIGEKTDSTCLNEGEICVWGNIKSGSYNFFENRLSLFGTYKNLSCRVEVDGLSCGGCEPLKRISDETKGPRVLIPPAAKNLLSLAKTGDSALQGEVSSIQGKYTGYLHHEFLDRYQAGSLSILTYQAAGDVGTATTLRMSALGTLYFGDHNSAEAISYRFKERTYPNPVTLPQFVFSQEAGDVDAILQVTKLGNGKVEGIWFSQLFGKVGTFQFRKDGVPLLPAEAKMVESVTAQYESNDWELGLMVGLGSAAPNTENPFAPLALQGWVQFPRITPRILITGGSYDFYTGRIGVEFGESVLLGSRLSRKKLMLKKMNSAATTALPPHALIPYRVVDDRR